MKKSRKKKLENRMNRGPWKKTGIAKIYTGGKDQSEADIYDEYVKGDGKVTI